MAHNARIRAPGFWVALGVLDAAEMEQVDAARYLSIHEGGGTWAITDNVVIGAAGAQTWHYTLPVVADDISGHVVNLKSLTFDVGSLLLVNGSYTLHGAGGVTGVMTIGAAGSIVVTSGRFITFQGGSTLSMVNATIDMTGSSHMDLAAGAKVNVLGEVDILATGAIVFTDGGWIKGVARLFAGASFYFTAGTTTHVLGTFKFEGGFNYIESGATLTNKSGGNFTNDTGSDFFNLGTYHGAGPEIMSGGGYRARRTESALANADQTFDARLVCYVRIPTALSADRHYSLDVADMVDVPNGVDITFHRDGNTDTNGAFIVANGVNYFVFNADNQALSASVTFVKHTGSWRILHWSSAGSTQAQPYF